MSLCLLPSCRVPIRAFAGGIALRRTSSNLRIRYRPRSTARDLAESEGLGWYHRPNPGPDLGLRLRHAVAADRRSR